jgi:hypothetical protein
MVKKQFWSGRLTAVKCQQFVNFSYVSTEYKKQQQEAEQQLADFQI